MPTLYIIKALRREPSHLPRVAAAASEEMSRQRFAIITADPNVKGILVNIFCGIMKCDVIAAGVGGCGEEGRLKCLWWCVLNAPMSKKARRIIMNHA